MNVRSLVGWYVDQQPERANIHLQSLVDVFRDGMNHEQSSIDSELPDFQGIMSKIKKIKRIVVC